MELNPGPTISEFRGDKYQPAIYQPIPVLVTNRSHQIDEEGRQLQKTQERYKHLINCQSANHTKNRKEPRHCPAQLISKPTTANLQPATKTRGNLITPQMYPPIPVRVTYWPRTHCKRKQLPQHLTPIPKAKSPPMPEKIFPAYFTRIVDQ